MEKVNANVEVAVEFLSVHPRQFYTYHKCFELPNISTKAKEIHWQV